MSKRPRTPDTPKFWHTLKLSDQFMLILKNNDTGHTNQGVKLRQDNGTLWEAFGFMQRCERLYDDIHQLDKIEIEEIIKGTSMTVETFKEKCDPQKKCSFHFNGHERYVPISESEIFRKDVYAQILEGKCVPELVAVAKKTDEEMAADLLVKCKHVKMHDYDYNMTCFFSVRITLVRVPEY